MDSGPERVVRAIQDSSSSAAASSSDSNGGRAGAGTLVGAAEGAAGLLLFYADMVFSRGLHVAYYLSLGSHASRLLAWTKSSSHLTPVCGREIRYFSHTYQSRYTKLLQCNTALN